MDTVLPARTVGLSLSAALAMYVLIALSYVVNSMDRSVFSNLVTAVNAEFHLSLAQGGFLTFGRISAAEEAVLKRLETALS